MVVSCFACLKITQYRSNFGSPWRYPTPTGDFWTFARSSFFILILRLNASLRCFRIFLETCSFFGTSLSSRCAQRNRCAQTEILPISPLDLQIVIPWSSELRHSSLLVASELLGTLCVQLALSTMMRSVHCASEGGTKCSILQQIVNNLSNFCKLLLPLVNMCKNILCCKM